MKITCISDCHGHLPDLKGGDILAIAGDFSPTCDHSIPFQKEWIENNFNPWLDSLDFDAIVCVAGNHDFIGEKCPDFMKKTLQCNYLDQSSVTLDGVKFYGYPHTPWFCDWAFNCQPDELEVVSSNIPDDTNVLITHGPVNGILDVVTEGRQSESCEHLGDTKLRKRIHHLKNLKLHVCGHIHSGRGKHKINETTFVNASYVDEMYQPYGDFFVVEI